MKVTIISDRTGRGSQGHRIDTRNLPNPYTVARFRPRDGRDPEVRAWITSTPEARTLITDGLQAVEEGHTTITVLCSAGRHRSVAIVEAIADNLRAGGHDVETRHRVLEDAMRKKKPKRTTTEAHLGWTHQQARERLLRRLRDGDTCWWCGRPMEHTMALDADHTTSRSHGGRQADRLLHARCNRQRGAGDQDDRRPALHTPNGLPALPVRLTKGGDDPRWHKQEPERPPTPTPGAFTWGNVSIS
ncbi:hypothetical protein [Corynebacterium nuruki]|uniref:RapZ C-terminal domain-containing protein n=1 Tax=Corynebacterium nuruki TaxID=1032851 RepID=UPI0039BF26E5